jgi:multidrug efflux pump
LQLPEFCIRRPVFTVVLSLILVVIGLVGFLRIPVRGYPNTNSPVISVTTLYPGASASTVESQITTPLENALVGASGLESIHSSSAEGTSSIRLTYDASENINDAVNDVQVLLAKFSRSLPKEVFAPIVQKHDMDSLQTLVLALTDPNKTPMALTDYAERNLLPDLEQTSGVSNVELYNQRDYALKILLNPGKMAANNVTVSDLDNVLASQNTNVPGGQIKTQSRYFSIVTKNQLSSVDAFKNLIIRQQNGDFLRFSDVADISVLPENTDTDMRVNGVPAIGLGIYSQPTANPITVAHTMQNRIEAIAKNFPEGMHLSVVWDDTRYLKAILSEVYQDIGLAVLLVIGVVMLFLGSPRSALIPIVTIPICLMGTCAFIYFLGFSINVFTLLAFVLAIGLVVDDAIIMLENIYRYIELGMSPFEAAIKGSKEIAFPIVAMTLTLAAVYAPIGFASGMVGILFRQFAFTLALAVIISGFVALTLSPMMCARLLKLPEESKGIVKNYSIWLDHIFHRLTQSYQKILRHILAKRAWVLIFLLILMGIGYFTYRSSKTELSPKEDMSAFLVSMQSPPNASFAYTNEYSKRVEALIKDIPEVMNTVMIVGSPQSAFSFVVLKPWSERSLSAQQIINHFLKKTPSIPGVKIGAFNLSQIGGGGKYGDSVQVVLMTNQTYDQLHQTAEKMIHLISQYPGVRNVDQDLQMTDQEYVIHVNRSMAAAMHVNMSDITKTLQTMLGGETASEFNWDNKNYDVIMQIPDKDLTRLQIVNQLYVKNSDQKMIPLSSLVTLSHEVGPQALPHENRMRADTLTMQVSGNVSMGQVIDHIKSVLNQHLPNGYQFLFKGAAQKMLQSQMTIIGSFALALVFIYLVLSAQFESFLDPLIILLTVPFSIVGALITLKLTGHDLSVYTDIGFITLVGLISKHGILITEFANQKRAEGLALTDAIVEAASLRLRPILMTTAAMVFGAIPLALASGAGALSRQHIGWVIVGGLFFGTFFSLIVVPVAYSLLKKDPHRPGASA